MLACFQTRPIFCSKCALLPISEDHINYYSLIKECNENIALLLHFSRYWRTLLYRFPEASCLVLPSIFSLSIRKAMKARFYSLCITSAISAWQTRPNNCIRCSSYKKSCRFHNQLFCLLVDAFHQHLPSCNLKRVLFENRPALYFCNYKKNYKLIHVCWIPQKNDFMYIMEQYFHY